MRKPLALIALLLAPALLGAAPSSRDLDFGRTATAEDIARADISVDPSGDNLPDGSGSAAKGAEVYAAKCQSCHGANGAGGPSDRLTGGVGSLTTRTPVKTLNSYWPYATTAFDYIRRAMPVTAPQSLTADETYAVLAYLLSVDGLVARDAVLDKASLARLRMPNRDGFVSSAPKGGPRPRGR